MISTKADTQQAIKSLGATAAIGSVEDAAFLSAAFERRRCIYAMLPPPAFTNPDFHLKVTGNRIAGNYVNAIKQAGVKHGVVLSTIDAYYHPGKDVIERRTSSLEEDDALE